ncbi:hypothetical protein MPSEU_000854600 [Mayamaea pseudoterrestris]|nr:hypothetical protein MPSEU_000854600 [Mayamaea pseudoterrestris]
MQYYTRLSSSKAARDTRLANRRQRFYLDVGIQPIGAPWLQQSEIDAVDSSISAGVDGTSSASGVSLHMETSAQVLQKALVPRQVLGVNDDTTTNDTTSIYHTLSWHTVTLDGRVLRTPMGRPLSVPSQKLAMALAHEWNAVTFRINPTQMPLMTLVCTVLDQVSQPLVQQQIRQDCMNFLSTDTICYYADPLSDRVLHRQQEEHWQPVHDFIAKQFGNVPATVQGAQEATLSKRLAHPPQLTNDCLQLLSTKLDAWHLQCLYSVCRETKSLLLGLAILLNHYHSLQEAVEAARVEEEFQISCWGLVEGGHDYDRLNCAVQIQAAVVLMDCLASDCFANIEYKK